MKRQSRKNTLVGGSGAAEYATAVYGPAGEHHADHGNVIAMKTVGGRRNRSEKTGRSKKNKRSQRGGSGMTEILVPAVFLVANQLYKKSASGTKKRYGRA